MFACAAGVETGFVVVAVVAVVAMALPWLCWGGCGDDDGRHRVLCHCGSQQQGRGGVADKVTGGGGGDRESEGVWAQKVSIGRHVGMKRFCRGGARMPGRRRG